MTNEELITGLRHISHTMERNGHSYYQHIAEDAIKAMFPSMETFRSSDVVEIRYKVHDEVWCVSALDIVWWDKPYKRGEEDGKDKDSN